MKKLILLLGVLPILTLVFVSCDKEDDELSGGLRAVTAAEIEKVPSFSYSHSSSVSSLYSFTIYIWFRNGKMTYWKNGSTSARSDYYVYNYTISGKQLSLTQTTTGKSYRGYITTNGEKLILSQGLDGTNLGNLPDDMVQWYSYSTADLSK